MSTSNGPTQPTRLVPQHVAILLDRTGSMNSIATEAVGGLNAILDGLRKVSNRDIYITLRLFDSISIDELYQRIPLQMVKNLEMSQFVPRASTPLYDAIGGLISSCANSHHEDVLCVIITDGEENASHEYNLVGIQTLIKTREDVLNWEFTYTAVGVDAWGAIENISRGTRSYGHTQYAGHSGQAMAASAGAVSLAVASFVSGEDKSLAGNTKETAHE